MEPKVAKFLLLTCVYNMLISVSSDPIFQEKIETEIDLLHFFVLS